MFLDVDHTRGAAEADPSSVAKHGSFFFMGHHHLHLVFCWGLLCEIELVHLRTLTALENNKLVMAALWHICCWTMDNRTQVSIF